MSTPMKRGRAHRTMVIFDRVQNVQRTVAALESLVGQAKMIETYGTLLQQHSLTAPVAAVLQATPGFAQAVKNFPDAAMFNMVPARGSSPKFAMAMESLVDAADETSTHLATAVDNSVASFEELFDTLAQTATDLKEQLVNDKASLETCDIDDELVAQFPVYTLSEDRFGDLINMMQEYLGNTAVFDIQHLRDNPERVKEELDALSDLADDMGEALGVKIEMGAVKETNRSSEYEPTQSTFGEKGLTRTSLMFFMDKAVEICNTLISIGERKDEFINALRDSASDVPGDLYGDETTYGAVDHCTLVQCYVALNAKVIREAIVLASRLLTAADGILDVVSEHETVEEEA